MPRNILQLGSSIDTGGAERVIANLTRHLDRSRFNVWPCHLFSPRGAIGDELVRDGYEVLDIGRIDRDFRRYLSFRLVKQLVRERGIDLIHTHTHYALGDAALAALSSAGGVKVVHTYHYGNYPHLPGRYLFLEGLASRMANRLVAVGTEQEKQIRETYRLRRGRIEVIWNGVDAVQPAPDPAWRERLGRSGAVIVGTICTFIEQKGLPDLLRVAGELTRANTNVVFVVVGDGHLRPSIEGACASMGLSDRVLFTGWKREASASMLPLFDIFFQPSRWEAMSMVVLEAMAAGKAVVATDVGDNRHVVAHGDSGFVVPAGDIDAMSGSIRALVESSSLRTRFGEAGRARHRAHHGVDRMVQGYEQLYEGVLAGRGRGRP